MPWAIPFNAIKIIDFNASNSAVSIHSLQPSRNSFQIKPKTLEKDVKLATVGQMYVTVRTYALKERMVNYLLNQSIHDNLNSFIGICFEKNNELYIMWRHCFRSTLAHFIFDNDIANGGSFADDFRSSFLRDIIRGLDYLHSSPIGYHGSLTTRQCLINNHWILKLSGFGLLRLVYKWKKSGTLTTVDNSPIIRNSAEYEDNEYEIYDEAARAMIPNYLSLPNADGVHPNLLELVTKCCSRTPELRPDATLTRKITDAALKKYYCRSIATELKAGRPVEAKVYHSVTIMYSDIVGFTSLCSESLPMQVVRLLNGVFRKFDMIISNNQCYKVETIGDAYMVAAGIPEEQEHHVCNIALTALQMREFLDSYEIPHRVGQKLHCRWGFNSGSVFSGVVGLSAPRYCIFGETTLLASKMENRGIPDRIQTTFSSYKLLSEADQKFIMSPRGSITIEGFGTLLTYWLEGIES
uniref:guanylate cyclase n=1 Tax=Syphacia muris TaxID=451379 RepID=A0A0N5ALR4_9BILA